MNIFTFASNIMTSASRVVIKGCEAAETAVGAVNDCALLAKGTTEAMLDEQAEENKQRLQVLIGELKAVKN